jgi:uncharacterized protein YndB with AHSA1/START domain
MDHENSGNYGEFSSPREVRLIRILEAPIERVWAFLTDSEKRETWLAAGPMELKQHGRVRLEFNHALLAPHEVPPAKYKENGKGLPFEGVVTQCEAPGLLSFTWEGESELALELTSLEDETRMVVTHRRLASTEETVGVAAGWHLHLAYLAARLTGQEPPHFWATLAQLEDEYATRVAAAGTAL